MSDAVVRKAPLTDVVKTGRSVSRALLRPVVETVRSHRLMGVVRTVFKPVVVRDRT